MGKDVIVEAIYLHVFEGKQICLAMEVTFISVSQRKTYSKHNSVNLNDITEMTNLYIDYSP